MNLKYIWKIKINKKHLIKVFLLENLRKFLKIILYKNQMKFLKSF